MNLLEKICEELGVEVGEEWLANDGRIYKIISNGEIFFLCGDELHKGHIEFVLTGDLRPIWKPKKGGLYYIPAIYDIGDMWQEIVWLDDAHDIEYYSRGLVFKTKEEAVDATDKMLRALKEG